MLLLSAQVSFAQAKGFALLELFTSEGCSSCPPADKLAAATLKEYAGQSVYILAYHVDYWNRLGWKDIYSNSEWSTRQNDYAGPLHMSSVYTPQIIVNGSTEFVGSDARKLHVAIKAQFDNKEANSVSLKAGLAHDHTIAISYNISGDLHGKQLKVAIVQKNASSSIKAGENSGKVLAHVNVVRSLTTIPLNDRSAAELKLGIPDGLNAQDIAVIAFVQKGNAGAITGASAITTIR